MALPASRALTKFTDGLTTTLLKLRDAYPSSLIRPTGMGSPESAAFDKLYYSTTVKNFDAFIKAFPPAAFEVTALRDRLIELTAARKAELASEKARKAGKRERLESARTNITSTGVRLGVITRETFDTLNACMAPARAEYIAQHVTHYKGMLASFIAAWNPAGDEKQHCFRWVIVPHIITRQGTRHSGYRYAMRPDAEDRLVTVATEMANLSFDSYLVKLAGKIAAPITSATVAGSLWSNSRLEVTTHKGNQLWHTKCIINRSVLGKLFNQFPTRLVTTP